MALLGYISAGCLGAAITLLGIKLRGSRRHTAAPAMPAKSDVFSGQKPKGIHKKYDALEGRVRYLEAEIKNRASAEKLNSIVKNLHDEIAAIEANMRAVAQRQELASQNILPSDHRNPQPTGKVITTEKLSVERDDVPIIEAPALPLPDLQGGEKLVFSTSRREPLQSPETQRQIERPSVMVTSQPHAPEKTATPTLASRESIDQAGTVIMQSFDSIDALSMRRIEKMQEEYRKLLGSALSDVSDRSGAYLFTMRDGTAWVHPKPNSPLPRFWERAFPGGDSYSRPITHVDKLARVQLTGEEEYVVLEKGSFEVT